MKATDLMIGDYLQDRNSGDILLIREISDTHLTGDSLIAEHLNGYDEGEVLGKFMDEVEPIPLTPEILEKNGFKYVEKGDHYVLNLPYKVIDIYHHENFKWELFSSFIDGYLFDYVHELQHALKLCGIKKKITL